GPPVAAGGLSRRALPPASIALPGRSITQFTVLPVALAAWPTKIEMPDSTVPTGPRLTTVGAAIGAAAGGPATTTGESACAGGSLAAAGAAAGGTAATA